MKVFSSDFHVLIAALKNKKQTVDSDITLLKERQESMEVEIDAAFNKQSWFKKKIISAFGGTIDGTNGAKWIFLSIDQVHYDGFWYGRFQQCAEWRSVQREFVFMMKTLKNIELLLHKVDTCIQINADSIELDDDEISILAAI